MVWLTESRFDKEGVFQMGFTEIRDKLAVHFYTSVSAFTADFGAAFSSILGETLNTDAAGSQANINGETQNRELSAEYKEKRKLAKRIVKAVQPSLEDATKKESELLRKPFEKELQHLDRLLELSLSSRRDSLGASLVGEITQSGGPEEIQRVNGTSMEESVSNGGLHTNQETSYAMNGLGIYHDSNSLLDDSAFPAVSHRAGEVEGIGIANDRASPQMSKQTPPIQGFDLHAGKPNISPGIQILEPPTPPMSMSMGGDLQPLSNVPWYMETFDPDGSTVQEERWTGRDLVRGMSEELSDMGDEELSGLVDPEISANLRGGGEEEFVEPNVAEAAEAAKVEARRKAAAKRKRWRGYR